MQSGLGRKSRDTKESSEGQGTGLPAVLSSTVVSTLAVVFVSDSVGDRAGDDTAVVISGEVDISPGEVISSVVVVTSRVVIGTVASPVLVVNPVVAISPRDVIFSMGTVDAGIAVSARDVIGSAGVVPSVVVSSGNVVSSVEAVVSVDVGSDSYVKKEEKHPTREHCAMGMSVW